MCNAKIKLWQKWTGAKHIRLNKHFLCACKLCYGHLHFDWTCFCLLKVRNLNIFKHKSTTSYVKLLPVYMWIFDSKIVFPLSIHINAMCHSWWKKKKLYLEVIDSYIVYIYCFINQLSSRKIQTNTLRVNKFDPFFIKNIK